MSRFRWPSAAPFAVAAKLAEVAFAGIVTVPGRASAALFDASDIGKPPASAVALIVTVQLSVPDPATRKFELQVTALTPGVPVPVIFASEAGFADKLLVIIKGSV
jgi:hypothetical protein